MVNDEKQPTRPDAATRATEDDDARIRAGADDLPTPDEEEAAERAGDPGPDVERNYEEAMERGAKQKGEGRLP